MMGGLKSHSGNFGKIHFSFSIYDCDRGLYIKIEGGVMAFIFDELSYKHTSRPREDTVWEIENSSP